MIKGFLLIDGKYNAVLIHQEDLYKPLNEILAKAVTEDEVKMHKTKKELNTTISEYKSGVYRVHPESIEEVEDDRIN